MNKGILFLSMLVALLACRPSVSVAEGKDKPCLVIGQVKDYLTHVLIEGAKVTLLTKDGVPVDSGRTSKNQTSGNLTNVYWVTSKTCDMPDMLLQVEADGYETALVTLPAKSVHGRGSICMRYAEDVLLKRQPKTVELKGVEVKATKIKFYHKGDTLVFNADAFQLSQGSMLDGLIRQMPGVELKDDGRIYVNGKYVESLLLNGENFFSKDRKIMLDNLPAYMVKNVKVYDKSSQLGERLHKKLGDETYVMDVHLKKEYNTGWIANVEAGGGTHDRYLARLFGLRFTNHSRVSLFGNLNNLNDDRRPGEATTWTPDKMPSGERTQRQAGLDYLVKQKDTKYKLSGNVVVTHNDEQALTRQNTLNYLTEQNSWTRYQQQAANHTFSVSSDNDWKWTPSKKTNFWMQPKFSWQRTRNRQAAVSATFNENPEDYVGDAAALIDSISRPQAGSLLRRIAVNRLLNSQLEKSDRISADNAMEFDQDLTEDMMTTLGISGGIHYQSNKVKTFSQYRLDYPAMATAATDYRNRYGHSQPNYTLGYNLGTKLMYWFDDIMYILPSYNIELEHQHHDYALYRLDRLADYGANSDTPLGSLPSTEAYESTIDLQNSFWRSQNRVSNTFSLLWCISRWHGDDKDIWVYVNLPFQLNNYHMDYRQADYDGSYHRRAWFFNPTFILRKMWDSQNKYVDVRYFLTHEMPDLVRFIPVRNDADPLNVILGNAGLRNPRTHIFELQYNGNSSKKPDLNFSVWVHFYLYQNALAMGYTYNRNTGARVFKPYSVNGNSIFQAGIEYATALGKSKLLSLDTKTRFSATRSVDLMSVVTSDDYELSSMPGRSIVHNSYVTEDLKLEYKFPWLRLGLNGYLLFYRASSGREGFQTQRVWDFHYGPTVKATLPWQIELSTDLSIYSRRGYDDRGANTNDVVWNARLSKSLPKLGLTFMVDGFDMLHQLSNRSVTMNAQGRTEVWRNVLPNYVLFHVVYRLSKKPKK